MSAGTQTVVASDFRGYLQTWADVLAAVLTDLSGTATNCEVLAEAPAEKPSPEGGFCIRGTVSGRAPGAFAIVIPRPAVQQLLKANKAEPGVEGTDLAIALREIFSRVTVQLTTTLAMNHALEEVSSANPPQTLSSQSYWLRLNSSPMFLLELQLGADLLAAWQPGLASPRASRRDCAVTEVSTAGEDRLEVLRHVELAVSMRFGGRRMLLKDILDLCAGSIVQLDQQVQEPVELLLDGRLIARGEVVVVDGNYGLRITEVPVHAGH